MSGQRSSASRSRSPSPGYSGGVWTDGARLGRSRLVQVDDNKFQRVYEVYDYFGQLTVDVVPAAKKAGYDRGQQEYNSRNGVQGDFFSRPPSMPTHFRAGTADTRAWSAGLMLGWMMRTSLSARMPIPGAQQPR